MSDASKTLRYRARGSTEHISVAPDHVDGPEGFNILCYSAYELAKHLNGIDAALTALREELEATRARLAEASFLLQRDAKDCPRWEDGKGDCDLPDCNPCRVRRCYEQLDAARSREWT